MKAILVSPNGVNYGGVGTYTREIAHRLIQEGYEVTIITQDLTRKETAYAMNFINVRTFGTKRVRQFMYSLSVNLYAILTGCDIIQYNSCTAAVLSFLSSAFRIPNVLTVHGAGDYLKDSGQSTDKVINRLKWLSVKNAFRVTAVSQRLADRLNHEYGREFEVIPHGATMSDAPHPKFLEAIGLQKNEYIVFVGRFIEEKGLDLLLEAYNQIVQPQKKLLVVGGVQMDNEYTKRVMELGKDNPNVIYTGIIYGQNDMAEIQGNAYLCVSPMIRRAIPLTVIEAMALGTPVLSSDVDDREVYEHTFRFKNRDMQSLQNALAGLMNQPEDVYAMGIRGQEYIQGNHSWVRTTGEYLKIYLQVVSVRKFSVPTRPQPNLRIDSKSQ